MGCLSYGGWKRHTETEGATMIPKTQKRLRGAQFFLQDLQKRARVFESDPEEFEFVLDAFLSAARSVTFVLKKEQKDKYNDWFEPVWWKNLGKDNQDFLDDMKERRNAAEKEGDAGVITDWEDIPLWRVRTAAPRYPGYVISGAHRSGSVGSEPSSYDTLSTILVRGRAESMQWTHVRAIMRCSISWFENLSKHTIDLK
jgi:hypothetical protein